MTVVIIALIMYGVSFLLSTLADYLINSHCEDPGTFYESLSDEFYTMSLCPFISPFVFIWLIHKILKEMEIN